MAVSNKKQSLAESARKIVAECEDVETAAARLLEVARRDDEMLAHLIGDYAQRAARRYVIRLWGNERRDIWQPLYPDQAAAKSRVEALARANAESLLDFRLPGGKLLRHAVEADLRLGSSFYRERAETMAHRARWLDAVASALPKGRTVGETMSEAKVLGLAEEAQ